MKSEEKNRPSRRNPSATSREPAKGTQPEAESGSSQLADNISAGGDVVGGDKIVAGGDVVGRDKITNVTIGRNVIQIGTLAVPTLPAVIAALSLTAGLVFIGLSVRVTAEPPGPARMERTFNVAVAQFGKENEQGHILPSDDGLRLSRTVFDALIEQTREFENAIVRSGVQIWHDDLPASEMGTEIGMVANETAAVALAERISANMVIYGYIDRQNGFILKFYVSPEVKGEIDSVVTGRHELGAEPIRLDPAASLAANTDLATRTSALFFLTIGLTYDALGRTEDSLAVYRQARQQLTGWNERGEGKEVLYFFLGQAALFSSQKANAQDPARLEQEAQQAFESALNSNPSYARAYIGLGSVYYLQALDTQPLSALLSTSDALAKAFDEYNQARALAKQSADKQAEILATYSLGTAYYLQGGAYRSDGQIGAADKAFRQAINTFDAILASLQETNQQRLLGQAYQAKGAAYMELAKMWAEQGDEQKAADLYEQARQTFDQCIALGDVSQDEILLELIIRDKCVPPRNALDIP